MKGIPIISHSSSSKNNSESGSPNKNKAPAHSSAADTENPTLPRRT